MILAGAGKCGVWKSTIPLNLAFELDATSVNGDVGMVNLYRPVGTDQHDVLAGRVDVREPVRLVPCGHSPAGARAADAR